MNKHLIFFFLLFVCRFCDAQNLVPNGDLEQYTICPTNVSQFQNYIPYWLSPSNGDPDYFNSCNTTNNGVPSNARGWQYAHSGVAYCGIVTARRNSAQDYREYIEAPLTSTLTNGTCYHFEMYINLAELSEYNSDDIGVYFSDSAITVANYGPLPYAPQINNTAGNYPDTTNWIKVAGDYNATGTENYLLIGNFKDSANTNTYLFNSASLYNVTFVFIDDISLMECTTGIDERDKNTPVNVYPNPVVNRLHVSVKNENELSEIIVYDMVSRKLVQQKFTKSVTLNTESFAKGIYIYEVRNKNGVIKKGFVVKD